MNADWAADAAERRCSVYDALFLTAVCAFAFWLGLGHLDFWDTDEPRYALIAQEMLDTGDYALPRIDGKVLATKPAYYYWWLAASRAIFRGDAEFAMRLPSALHATALVLLLYWLGTRLFSRGAGLVSALVLATSAHFISLARHNTPDMMLAFYVAAAVAAFAVGLQEESARARWWNWMLPLCAGFSFLVKGPVGLLFIAMGTILPLIWMRRSDLIRRLFTPGSILVFLAVAVPWYLWACWLLTAQERFVFFIREPILLRVGSHAVHGDMPRYYYFLELWPMLAPWSIFLIPALALAIRAVATGRSAGRFEIPLCWMLGSLAVMTFVPGKRALYLCPLYPAAALMTGVALADALSAAPRAVRAAAAIRWLFAAVGVLGIVIAAALAVFASEPMRGKTLLFEWYNIVAENASLRWTLAAIAGLGGAAILAGAVRNSLALALRALAVCVLAVSILANHAIGDKLNPEKSIQGFVAEIAPQVPRNEPLIFFFRPHYAMMFYARLAGMKAVVSRDGEEAEDFLNQTGPRYVVVKDDAEIRARFERAAGIGHGHRYVVLSRQKMGPRSYMFGRYEPGPRETPK